jgi:hypothetical protein
MAIQTLRCPHCNAPLKRDAQGQDPKECPFCHSALLLNKPGAMASPPSTNRPFTKGNMVAAGIVAIVIPTLIVISLFRSSPPSPPPPVAVPAVVEAPPPPPPPKKVEPPSPVKEVLKFGEAGTNPGQLDHANHLALASDGSFFVGETSNGRVQKFDATGKYVDSITLPPDKLTKKNGVFGMAADAKGNVYVNRVGDVLVYDAATLKLVKEIAGSYPDRYFHGGLAIDQSGNVLAMADRTGDISVFTLSPAGKVLSQKKAYAKDVAVDGTGRMFLVGESGLEVRDSKGEVTAKIGTGGKSIAFDGKGRLYVSNFSEVNVVSVDGAKIATLPVRGDDIGLDAQGRLVAVNGDHVSVFEVTLP